MFRKNLCDKVSKMKNLRLLSSSFFRAVCRGVLRFLGRCIFHGENRETKSPVLSFFQKTKIYENVLQKSLWQSFENKKSEMAIFFVFPRCSSWYTPFFRSTHFSWRKLWNKIPCFGFFEKSRKKATSTGRNGGGKIKKKIPRRIHLRVPSEPVVLDPRTFSVDPQKAV